MISRVVEPELLDELPPGDLAAQRSRADLRRLNWMMGHAGLLAGSLRTAPSVKRICDLGSGDGSLILRVAQKMHWRDVELTMVDRKPVISPETEAEFTALGWRSTIVSDDVFAALRAAPRCDVITANLFLHHFASDELIELLALIAERANLFIACEPRRSALALWASRKVGLAGCGSVTRHDAIASVRAGFRNGELTASWPTENRWRITERGAGLFSHLFMARKW